jgi:hypothetical protein
VLASGPFVEVEVRTGESSRLRDAEVDALVEAEWAAQLARARAAGTPYADNPAYRLEAVETDGDRAVLTLASEPYRVHAAMKVLHDHPAVTEAHGDRILVADGIVRTRDGAVVLQRLPKVAGTATELVGSTCAPHVWPITTGADLTDYLAARVARGLVVEPARVRVGPLLGLVLHEVGCVCAVWDVVVDADLEEVRAGHPMPEVLLAVPPESLRERLAAEGGYLPAVADLPLEAQPPMS